MAAECIGIQETKIGYWVWNGSGKPVVTDADGNEIDSNTYKLVTTDSHHNWIQTHDVDANMEHRGRLNYLHR
ncbi:MAG: hypothetical protein ACLS61_11190 [Ruminococcus sp.]